MTLTLFPVLSLPKSSCSARKFLYLCILIAVFWTDPSLICYLRLAATAREYLVQHLESRFSKALVGMVMYNVESVEIAKPSELLNSVKTYMNVLHSIENYVHIDITRVFNDVLLQQTQPQDSHGDKTITSLYTNWYLEVLLRKVSTGQIVYSPVQKAFVTLPSEQPVPFLAEEFSDVTELRALAELIGPYGIKYLNESLMWHVASQVTELKKLVVLNKEVLVPLRSNFNKPEQMKELFKRLQNVDNLLQRPLRNAIKMPNSVLRNLRRTILRSLASKDQTVFDFCLFNNKICDFDLRGVCSFRSLSFNKSASTQKRFDPASEFLAECWLAHFWRPEGFDLISTKRFRCLRK